MPKTSEEIKHDPVSAERWRNNATQVGGLWFDPRKIKPLGNHILVDLDREREASETILAPDVARNREIGTRLGTVISVGPGTWHEDRSGHKEPIPSWIILPLKFKPTSLKVGDRVVIGHFSDWESWFSDFEGRGRNIVLCQEADVRLYDPA